MTTTDTLLHPLLSERWSPRGFDGAHALGDEELALLLEAARWAPSASNSQPWRFLVTRRGEEALGTLAGLLMPGNQVWATRASALLLVAAEVEDESGKARPWAQYDTGQAVAALSLQAGAAGLHVHQMGGFDAAGARAAFGLDDRLVPVVVVAVGRHDPAAQLPAPLAERERAPRTRTPVQDLMLTGVTAGHRAA